MPIKSDWKQYLHETRARQIAAIFGRCAPAAFPETLELGAGDGFVSDLLAPCCGRLIATDINPERLDRRDAGNVAYRILDAETVGEAFPPRSFDLVFSSNLLEHLPDCPRALAGIHAVLKDDGLSVHILPTRAWKLATIALHIPNKLAKLVDRVFSGRWFHRRPADDPRRRSPAGARNNPKAPRRRRFILAKIFLPRVHGVSSNTWSEFLAFGRQRWIGRFQAAGFDLLETRGLGFNSGYGFGCPRLRRLMEWLGVHSARAYVLVKAGSPANAGRLAGEKCEDGGGSGGLSGV